MLFTLPSALLPTLLLLSNPTTAYKPLSDAFLRAIPSPDAAIDYKDGPLLAPLLVRLNLITNLKRLPPVKAHTTLGALAHLLHILLDVLERRDGSYRRRD